MMKAVINVKDTYVRNKISSLTFMLSIAIVIYHSDCKRAMHYISMDMLYYITEFCSAILNFVVPIVVLVFLYCIAFILKRRASSIYYIINGGRG